ncbi:MAG: pyroglutamyl-peptidase I [Clostridia bacterium]|nr:pyroglutamyl-peptidase I [Clostridia bacterium]
MILITAFEPFGGSATNTSSEVLRLLPVSIAGHPVKKLVLPVVFGKAAEAALRFPADYVFLLGEAGGRNCVTPEKRAKNLRDARIPDNAGAQPRSQRILPRGPDEYRTALPVEAIAADMQDGGIAVSEDAGAFVCNDTFYLVGTGSACPVDFIHVPAVPDQAEKYAETVLRFITLAVSSHPVTDS